MDNSDAAPASRDHFVDTIDRAAALARQRAADEQRQRAEVSRQTAKYLGDLGGNR